MTAYPSWTALTAGVTIILAAHWNEVKDAVDHMQETLVTNGCSLSAYSWSSIPVSVGDIIYKADVDEYRAGIDYVYDANTCSSNNGTKNNTVNSHNSGVL
jgi:hypothetical protein